MEKIFVLALILLSASEVRPAGHSLLYYYTVISASGLGLPDLSVVGYVDDQEVTLYSSDTGRTVPVAPWIKENEGPESWEQITLFDKTIEAIYRIEANLWKERMNHTKDVHFLQMILSCELRDDGSTMVYHQLRYDGTDYMHLDVQTASFIPNVADARIVTENWNRPDVRMGKTCKTYLENECMTRLKRFTKHGREVLERRVRPRVKVSGPEKGDAMKLHCQVYGFYPQAVDVKWMKNGEDEVPPYETTHVLPNPDGTYQIRVSAEVTPKEGDSYSCYVDHSSLEEPLYVKWEPKQSTVPTAIISAGVIIILVLASAGIIIYIKKKKCTAVSGEYLTYFTESHRDEEEEERTLRTPVTQDE